VAAVPVAAGIGDDDSDPVALAGGFRTAILVCVVLLVVGAVVPSR
jgi:hypothetical protein